VDEVITGYRRLLQLLEEEKESAAQCMGGDYLQSYLKIIEREEENLRKELRLLCNN